MYHAVLKLLPSTIGQAETRGLALAEQFTPPDFWLMHMVPASDRTPLPATDWWIHCQKLAHADLVQLRPLAALVDDPQFARCCGVIIEKLVDEWHLGHDLAPALHTPSSFLRDFLSADHLSSIETFCRATRTAFEDPPDLIDIPGRAGSLPNPLALLHGMPTDPESGCEISGQVELYVGNGHGDLHLFNILVSTVEPLRPEEFKLIDYGRFSPETPVSRDPVKLLLAVAAAWLPAIEPGSALRSNVAELVVDPSNHPSSTPIAGYLSVSKRIYDASSKWGIDRDMPDVWRRQRLLVLIGSALRTVADADLPLFDRWWFFEVAALATRAYGISWRGEDQHPIQPTTPPSLRRGEEPTMHNDQTMPTSRPKPAPVRYPGAMKLKFVRRLAEEWQALADVLDIPLHDQRQFQGQLDPARALYGWIEVRERLHELPDALEHIGRPDLAKLLRETAP